MIDRVGAKVLGRFAFLAFLAAVLGYGGFYAYYMLTNFDVVNLHRDTLIDDAFYYFEIAKNLAAGKFSTFDGGITRTNGYHPMWLLLVTPLYWVFDLESALFGIKALEIMLIAGGVCLMALAVRLARLPWILLFAVLPALYGQQGMTMGMEAAAGAFFLGATLLAAVLFVRDAERWRWLLAAIAFLLPWVRLEYVAIALFVTGALALLPRYGVVRGPQQAHLNAAWLRAEGMPFAAAIAGILAYFLYNGAVFGGIVPVSAASKLAWSAAWSVGDAVDWPAVWRRFADAAGTDALAVAELCAYMLAAWGVGRFRGWHDETVGLSAVLAAVLALGVENLALKAQIALLYDARLETYTYWYYVPGYLVAALMMPVRCYMAVFLLRRFVPRQWAFGRRLAVVAVCAVGVVLAFDPYGFTEPFRFVAEKRRSSIVEDGWALAQEAAAFEQMLPHDAVLGSWDAGAIGYFADRPVVNLDGLANSYDYLRAGPGTWHLWLEGEGVPEFGVTHLVNPLRQAQGLMRRFEYVGSRMFKDADAFSLKLWPHREGGLRTRSWRSITSPSVGVDGKRSGYRVLRSGRLVQVFVPDCAIEEQVGLAANVPEMLSFAWREGSETRRVQRLWVRPYRTETGYCTTTFLLPHGVEKAERVSIDATTVDRVVAGIPPVLRSRSGVAVFAVRGRLVYVREDKEPVADCLAGDGDLGVAGSHDFLHLHPAARRDLPRDRLDADLRFFNRDGQLTRMRRRSGDRCLADVELPPVALREIWMGMVRQGRRIWTGRVDGLALRPAAVDEFLAAAVRIVRNPAWDVYHHEGERKLLYVRKRRVAASEIAAGCDAMPVFAHVYPQRTEDLPAWRQDAGFANQDFDFGEQGFVSADRCLAAVQLPAYDLSHLVTGAPGGSQHTWHVGSDRDG